MGLFIWGRWRYDVVALIALAASAAVGAVPLDKIYSGLDNSAVITIACVMVISQTISRSGIFNHIIHRMGHLTKSPILHVASLSFITLIMSGFMNNLGALALIMPVAIKTALEHKRSPSFILMPIGFASALGGLLTLIGTPPNLLIANYRQEVMGHAYTMFDYMPVGGIVAAVGLLFIVLIGFRLLPKNRKAPKNIADMFSVEDYIFEISLLEKSKLVGLTSAELNKKFKLDFELIGVIRDGNKRWTIAKDFEFHVGDILIIETSTDNLNLFLQQTKTELASKNPVSAATLKSTDVNLLEAVVPQGARVEGRTANSLRLFNRYKVNILAISREGKPFKRRLQNVTLKAGDIVLLQGPVDTMPEHLAKMGFLPLIEKDIKIQPPARAYIPMLIFSIAILLTAVQVLPVAVAFGGAVLAMLLLNQLPVRSLYDSIDWSIIILLAAMIPIGQALQTTGGTDMIAAHLLIMSHHLAPVWVLLILMVMTMTISDFMNNAATAIVMAPIAFSLATSLHVHADPFLMGVAIASSCSFLTPIGHQNNILVMGPGGYKFYDFLRLGLPLEIIVLAVSIPALLWIWPL